MLEFTYSDGQEICLYRDGTIKRGTSKFIENYKNNALDIARSKQWKTSGSGAAFREGAYARSADEQEFDYSVSGVFFTEKTDEVVYTFVINGTSGVYIKDMSDEKSPETHVINSIDYAFAGGCLNSSSRTLATSLKRNYYNADIAVFDLASGDYKTVTDGDTLDEDPFINPENANIIYYASRGVGRDSAGGFAAFAPSAIYELDLGKVDVKEVLVSSKNSYFKPVFHDGKLYAIKAPVKQKSGNPFIEILLIPFRIIQAIVNFINIFVNAFTGKSLASGGNNPTRAREVDSREIEIAGNKINVEKERKKNASKKDTDFGIVPKSWQLIEAESGEVLASGVADFDIGDDGTVIYTNGRRIFALRKGIRKKLVNTEFCLRVSCRHSAKQNDTLFDF